MPRKTSVFFVFLLFVIAIFTANQSVFAQEKAKLRIGWIRAMANAPVLIAKEQGYFTQEGVEVELIHFPSGPLVVRALKRGDLDMAYMGVPPLFQLHIDGFKVKIISKVNYGQAAIIVNNDSPIRELSDLKGKKIASVHKRSGMDVLLRGMVLQDIAGLDPDKDVEIIVMPTRMMAASVDRNVVDAAFTWEPYVSYALLSGHSRVLLDMNKAYTHYPWYIVVATPEAIQGKREAVVKVLRAHIKAVEFLDKQPEISDKVIADVFNLYPIQDPYGKTLNTVEVISKARERLGWEYRISNKDIKFMEKLQEHTYDLGYIKKKIDILGLIDYSLLKEALKE